MRVGALYPDFQSIDSLLHVQGVFSEQSDVRAGYEDIGVVVHKYLLAAVETVAYAEYPVLKVKSGKVRQALSVDKGVDAGAGIAGFFKQIFLSVDEDAVLSAPEPDPRHLPRRSGSGGECADDVTAQAGVVIAYAVGLYSQGKLSVVIEYDEHGRALPSLVQRQQFGVEVAVYLE